MEDKYHQIYSFLIWVSKSFWIQIINLNPLPPLWVWAARMMCKSDYLYMKDKKC